MGLNHLELKLMSELGVPQLKTELLGWHGYDVLDWIEEMKIKNWRKESFYIYPQGIFSRGYIKEVLETLQGLKELSVRKRDR